jgi:hypothetical protein
MSLTFSGGEIRMNSSDWSKPVQGKPVGYQLTVVNPDDPRFGADARAETMEPLLELNEQLAVLGYEFMKLERIYRS